MKFKPSAAPPGTIPTMHPRSLPCNTCSIADTSDEIVSKKLLKVIISNSHLSTLKALFSMETNIELVM
jgi:hypothetical protein